MQSIPSTLVILGTGGTIAGTASDPGDHVGYLAGQIGVARLVAAVPALAHAALECEQVAQLDSKDMDHTVWLALAQRASHHLARPEVAGLVITHGTDTMEETAFFLQRVLAPGKPVVLTGAMRPATALTADGPQNLLDAVTVARDAATSAGGVCVVLAGRVHGAAQVQKRHPYRLDAFDSGEAGPLAVVEEGVLRLLQPWPKGEPPACSLSQLSKAAQPWPRVVILTSHAGADGAVVPALLLIGMRGLVVAGTGNGTLTQSLDAALNSARAAGVWVWRSTRCAEGAVVGSPEGALPSAAALSPVKARIEMMLGLIAAGPNGSADSQAGGDGP